MFWFRCAVLWATLLQLSGCANTTNSSSVGSAKNIGDIDVGMTQNQVLSILGQPQLRETYGGTEFLIYDNDAGRGVPIAIVGGRVTSIGRAAYDVVVRSKGQADLVIPYSKISKQISN
jgi:SmpA/OmlA family protein